MARMAQQRTNPRRQQRPSSLSRHFSSRVAAGAAGCAYAGSAGGGGEFERCRETVAQFGRADHLHTSHVADGRTLGRVLYAPLRDSGLAPVNASLLHALAFVLVMYAVAWVMYRKQWFVKV